MNLRLKVIILAFKQISRAPNAPNICRYFFSSTLKSTIADKYKLAWAVRSEINLVLVKK